MTKDFFEQLVAFQRNLSKTSDSDAILQEILQITRISMDAENVLILGIERGILGGWWVRNEGSRVTTHSMDVTRKALSSEKGYWRGGLAQDPVGASESQRDANILSCLASRVQLGDRLLGAIYCDVRKGERRFTDEDGEKLKMLGDIFAIYVDYFTTNQDRKQVTTKIRDGSFSPMLLGETILMKNLKADLNTAAQLSTSVLLYGESGSGKEVAAQYIHAMSARAEKALAAIHCAAIPRDLLESELFGHEKGAFSGAYRKHRGRMELANQGTLFLDEVGDIPLEFQVKLLRVIEDKRIWPVGSETEVGPLDFRLVCSTNRSLKKMVAEKTFREDLFYRISGMQIRLPSLRERIEDIPLLASYFASQSKNPRKLDDRAIVLLQSLDWPGNVRQLKTMVENARDLAAGSVITREAIEKQLEYQSMYEPKEPEEAGLRLTFEEIQRRWNAGELDAKELQNILIPLYLKANKNLSAVARKLHCTTPQQLREFRNFIYYRRKTGTIILPD